MIEIDKSLNNAIKKQSKIISEYDILKFFSQNSDDNYCIVCIMDTFVSTRIFVIENTEEFTYLANSPGGLPMFYIVQSTTINYNHLK